MTIIDTAIVGSKGNSLELAALGSSFPAIENVCSRSLQIRALAWPVVLVGMVAQSACLGMQDSWAPLKVLAVATFVNLFGDILLCAVLGYGIGGAAWATVASPYVGGFPMLKTLGDKGSNLVALSVPNLAELKHIINLAAPILFTIVSKVALYTIIIYFATSLAPITLGAHQVMIGIFHPCTVGGEPLSQTAEAFMPCLIYGSSRNLEKSGCLGVTLGCIAISVPWLSRQIFTNDPAIITQVGLVGQVANLASRAGVVPQAKLNLKMRSITVPFFLSFILTTPILPCERTLVAGRDLKFLGFSIASCFCRSTLLLLMFDRLGLGVSASWWTLVVFQLTRVIQNYTRLRI